MVALTLPEPPPLARQASAELVAKIAADIAAAGGWMSFDAYMAQALYDPQNGYYSGASHKFGAGGDFVTGPEISPLFGASLATQVAAWLADVPLQVLEFGAGTGALAAQVLNELARLGFGSVDYSILEVSPSLRQRQHHTINTLAPEMADRVLWLNELPERIDGVVLANEVLDAMPVRAFRFDGRSMFERGVTVRDGRLDWAERPASSTYSRALRGALEAADWPLDAWRTAANGRQAVAADALDYRSEYGEQAVAWTRTLTHRLGRAAVLLIDYGFPAREFYHPQRDRGTLMCHYRHHAHGDPFYWPGLQDVTAHIDFSAVAFAAQEAGAAWFGYTSQANLLLNCGILERLGQVTSVDTAAYAAQAQAVHQLVSEAEMGELFKALAFGVGCEPGLIGFERGDRSHVL